MNKNILNNFIFNKYLEKIHVDEKYNIFIDEEYYIFYLILRINNMGKKLNIYSPEELKCCFIVDNVNYYFEIKDNKIKLEEFNSNFKKLKKILDETSTDRIQEFYYKQEYSINNILINKKDFNLLIYIHLNEIFIINDLMLLQLKNKKNENLKKSLKQYTNMYIHIINKILNYNKFEKNIENQYRIFDIIDYIINNNSCNMKKLYF